LAFFVVLVLFIGVLLWGPVRFGFRRADTSTVVGVWSPLAERHEGERWSTDLDALIADPAVDIVFDASMTSLRAATLRQAMAAGNHVYTEKPTAETDWRRPSLTCPSVGCRWRCR
jgi:predicted dehydrogenase